MSFIGAGEMAQWLRVVAAILEDLGSTPSSSELSVTPVPGDLKPSFRNMTPIHTK